MSNLLVQWEVLCCFSLSVEFLVSIPDPGFLAQESDQFGQKMVHMEDKREKFEHFTPGFSKSGTYSYHLQKNTLQNFFNSHILGLVIGPKNPNLKFVFLKETLGNAYKNISTINEMLGITN